MSVQDEGKNAKIHSHDYYELVIVVRGEELDSGKRDLAPGRCIFCAQTRITMRIFSI